MGTRLLNPMTAVRIAWARTGVFSSSPQSEAMGKQANQRLRRIEEDANASDGDPNEREYVGQVVSAMDATHRSLDTIYKGRDLNFKENAKLRESSLESIEDVVKFGTRSRDFLRSLPGTAAGSAGGIGLLSLFYPAGAEIPSLVPWAVGIGAAALGYFVNQAAMIWSRRWKEANYIREDFDRGLYFQQYVERARLALRSLHEEACTAHRRIFGEDVCGDDEREALGSFLSEIAPAFCVYVRKHMQQGIIRCRHWPMCETGGPPETDRGACDLWPRGVA